MLGTGSRCYPKPRRDTVTQVLEVTSPETKRSCSPSRRLLGGAETFVCLLGLMVRRVGLVTPHCGGKNDSNGILFT